MICPHCNQQRDRWGEHPRSCVRIVRRDPSLPPLDPRSHRSRVLNAVSTNREAPTRAANIAELVKSDTRSVGMTLAELCREKRIKRVGYGLYVRAA